MISELTIYTLHGIHINKKIIFVNMKFHIFKLRTKLQKEKLKTSNDIRKSVQFLFHKTLETPVGEVN